MDGAAIGHLVGRFSANSIWKVAIVYRNMIHKRMFSIGWQNILDRNGLQHVTSRARSTPAFAAPIATSFISWDGGFQNLPWNDLPEAPVLIGKSPCVSSRNGPFSIAMSNKIRASHPRIQFLRAHPTPLPSIRPRALFSIFEPWKYSCPISLYWLVNIPILGYNNPN